jgi:methylmalonyl-CoA mutase
VVGLVSRRAQALVDLPTNHLRATNEAFALAVGGADTIVGRAFDELAPAPGALGRRVARNTQFILRDESHLGAVSDPAAGSYFLEALTDQLARAAWAELQRIEEEGGIEASIAGGALGARVDPSRSTLLNEVAKRKRTLVGVSDFALSGEAITEAIVPSAHAQGPFAPMRAAEPFEALRRRSQRLAASGRPPRALLACVGAPGDFRAREGFARRLFEAGGFAVSAASGPPDDPAWALDAIARDGAGVVVLCSSDEVYTAHAVALARALAPRALVVLAGKPGALAVELDAAGLAAAVHLGADVIATLAALLAKLEVVS